MVGLGLCRPRRPQHNFWPAKQEEEAAADEAESKQKAQGERAPENVDSPAWSPLGRREAKQASPSAGRFLCHSRRRCDDDKATKTSSKRRKGRAGKEEKRREGSARKEETRLQGKLWRGGRTRQGKTGQAKPWQGAQGKRNERRLKSSPRRLVCGPFITCAHHLLDTRTRGLRSALATGLRRESGAAAHFGNCALKCLRRDKINVAAAAEAEAA